MKGRNGKRQNNKLAVKVGRALRRAARTARASARAHGLPVYIWRDGKIVAEKP
jgi:hypothetical protein